MIVAALVLLFAQTTAPAPAAPPAADDIVVTRDKLRRLQMDADIDPAGDVRRCSVIVSSGDSQIDQQACVSLKHCVAEGHRGSEVLADCVDGELIAFVDAASRADRSTEGAR